MTTGRINQVTFITSNTESYLKINSIDFTLSYQNFCISKYYLTHIQTEVSTVVDEETISF